MTGGERGDDIRRRCDVARDRGDVSVRERWVHPSRAARAGRARRVEEEGPEHDLQVVGHEAVDVHREGHAHVGARLHGEHHYMSNVQPIAYRVARRFLGASPEPEIEPVYRLTADELAAVVGKMYGPIRKLWFVPSSASTDKNTIMWQAVGVNGQPLVGRVVMRSGIGPDNSIVLTPEVVIDSIT